MSEQGKVKVSEGWWLTRDGKVFLVEWAHTPKSYDGHPQNWASYDRLRGVYEKSRKHWSDDGRYMPPHEHGADLMEKLSPADPRVIAHEVECGRPVPVPAPTEGMVTLVLAKTTARQLLDVLMVAFGDGLKEEAK